jgi:FKBP-type peptidyl-prolyl cis-trans isomerase
MGVQGAAYYKSQGITKMNTVLLKKGFDDAYASKTPLLNPEQCNSIIQRTMQANMAIKNQQANAELNAEKAEGRKFLAANKARPGVVELPNGLQYEIIKQGTGPKPKATDTVKAHYAGTLMNGEEFDNSYKRGEPYTTPVTRVIPGWVQALQMMPVGSKWKLYIPSDLGYGDRGSGPIPGGAVLIFEIELLEIVNK